MAQRVLAGQVVEVNEAGYFTDSSQWTEAMAVAMARDIGIDLTPRHLDVLYFLRERHASGQPLTIRRIGKSGIVSIKEFYSLFPGGPLKVSSKLAGIPKPAGCT